MFSILKDSISYLSAIYGATLFSFIYKIIIARILGPRDYGLWSMLALILLYGNLLDLGLNYALAKEVPFYRGKGQLQEVNEVKNTVFTSVIIISIFFGLTILISSLFLSKYGNNLPITLSLIAFILVLQQIKNYVVSYFVAEKNFKAISVLIISRVFLGTLTLTLVIRFKFIGLPLGLVLGYLLVLLYIFNKYKLMFKPQINIKRFFSLLKIGFPIMAIVIGYTLFFTIDRIFIFKYLGKENLGYYGIVSAINGILLLLPVSLGVMAFPRLSERYGSEGKAEKLKEFICIPTIILAYAMPALLGIIYLFLPTAIKLFIPQYLPGIDAGRISLMGIMFFSVSIFAQKFLIAINRQLHCLLIILSALLLKIVLIYIFIMQQRGINGVVIAANIIYFIYSTFIIMFAAYHYKERFLESLKYLIRIYLPFLYLLLILFGFSYLKSLPFFDASNKITHLSIYFAILVIFIIMPLTLVIKQPIYSRFYDIIIKREQWKN